MTNPPRTPRRPALAFLVAAEILLAAGIIACFWHQDWRYSLPTPRPPDLVQPEPGGRLPLDDFTGGRPVLLHFVNPDCPCSRFNLGHVRELVRRYRDRVRFVAVLEGGRPGEPLALDAEVMADPGGRLARACGVYATPQAVVLDAAGRLYFRGNYNVSRYCVDPRTEFARLAVEALLAGEPPPAFPPGATTAYGCPIPVPEKEPRP